MRNIADINGKATVNAGSINLEIIQASFAKRYTIRETIQLRDALNSFLLQTQNAVGVPRFHAAIGIPVASLSRYQLDRFGRSTGTYRATRAERNASARRLADAQEKHAETVKLLRDSGYTGDGQ